MGMKKINRWFKSLIHGYDLPQLKKSKPWSIMPSDKICILAPHADDESIGCGGLLAKYGSQCDVILLTDGRLNGNGNTPEETVKIREAEFAAVMKFFNVRHYEFMRAQDGMLIDAYKSFEKIDFSDYDYVVMPHGHDAHKDHVVPQVFFRRLRKEKKNIRAQAVYYEVWAPLPEPTHYLDISEAVEVKRQAINMYVSQLEKIDYTSRIMGLNHYRGIRHFVEYEEDFVIE